VRKYMIILDLLIFTFFLYGWNSLFYHTHKAITTDAINSLLGTDYPDICTKYREIIIDGSGGKGEDAHSGPDGRYNGEFNGGHVREIWAGVPDIGNLLPEECINGVLINYKNGLIENAYLNIGRICHLTNDQAVPAHAANIYHAFKKLHPFRSQDKFERWTDDNYITGLIANVGAISDDDFPYKYYQNLQKATRGKIESNATYLKYWELSSETFKVDATDYEINQTQYWGKYGIDKEYRKYFYDTETLYEGYYTDNPEIVSYQLRDAVDNTARALATASKRLPSVIKPIIGKNDINPKDGTELKFKVYENRKNEIRYSVCLDDTANYIIDINGRLLKFIVEPLGPGTLLPWEKEISFTWNGKYKSGDTEKFPSFGKHKIIYKVKDKDDNETFKEYDVNYLPKVKVLVNGKNSYSTDYVSGGYTSEYFNINLNKDQTLGVECYHGEQKLNKEKFQFSYYIKDLLSESGPYELPGLSYINEAPDVAIKNKSTFNYCWDTKVFKDKSTKIRLVVKAGYSTTDQKSELFVEDSTQVDTYRPITLGTISMVFKKPDAGTKNVYGFIAPLQEIDTLRVTVPLSVDPDKWGGVEILKNGDLVSGEIYKPLTVPAFTETDTTRTYKFVWDFSNQPEGFVTMRARYVGDPLSYSQKKIKVGISDNWEDFENASNGAIPLGWETKTQYAFPPGNGPEVHYWRTNYMDDIKSTELRTSTSSFSAQRFEILSPVITIPPLSEDVETYLYFDYARELGDLMSGAGGRTLMVMQYCDEYGDPLPFDLQPVGSISQQDDYPITGYPLNLPNFFAPNPYDYDMQGMFADNLWHKMTFWLSWSENDLRLPTSHRKIRIKFIQFYTVNFVGIIDNWYVGSVYNPVPFVYNPPAYTDLTYHRFDNFQVRTFYMINLPPTIDKVADQEVKQHCGWQKINLTGITNGQNAILGDNEDLENQGKSTLRYLKAIKDVEQREDGSLKITAIVEEDSTFKEVTLPSGSRKGSKFLPQKVVEITLYSDNRVVIPADSLKLELAYTAGDTAAVLMYRPEDIESGESNITVTIRDDGGTEHNGKDYTEMKFKITVAPFNPPVYDPPTTELESITEDFDQFTINLGSHFKDPENDKINYKISADSSLINIKLENDALKIKSVPDAYGSGSLTIMADDSTGTIPTVVQIPINIANDFDDFEFIEYEIVDEDSIPKMFLPTNFEAQSINIDEKFNCELTGTRTYSVALSNIETLNAGISGSSLNLTSKTDIRGSVDATLGVSVNGRSISMKIRMIVGNLPPEIKAEIADIETPANFKTMYINLKDHYTDPNKDWLGYSVRTTQNKIDTYISFYDDQLIIESKANESGIDSLYISIYDGEFTVRDSLKITIGTPTVQVPYLATPIEDIHTKEDFGTQTVDLSEHFANPDNINIIYVVDFDSTKVKCSIENGILIMKSVKDFHGYAPIHVSIDDGVKIIRNAKFEGCDPKNVVRISEKIKKKNIKKIKK